MLLLLLVKLDVVVTFDVVDVTNFVVAAALDCAIFLVVVVDDVVACDVAFVIDLIRVEL